MRELVRQYEGRVVAVTGGSGYLASALCAALSTGGARLLIVSRQDVSPIPGAESLKTDVCTPGCWRGVVQRADVIFHLAGNTSVYAAAKDPDGSFRSTVLPLTYLAAAARDLRRQPRVVYASTVTLYGLVESLPVGEDVPPRPITTYCLHKLFAEQQVELASRLGVIDGSSLRLANVYGPSPAATSANDRGVLNRSAILALQGSDLRLYGDGHYLRDYIYIEDVVRAFLLAGVNPGMTGRSFNVATGSSCTVREAFHLVAEQAEKVTGKKVDVHSSPWPPGADPIELRNFTGRIERIASACGWKPRVPLAQGIEHLVNYFADTATSTARRLGTG